MSCARVVVGGLLTSNKGINLPGVRVSALSLTAKDREDLDLGIELGVDYIALSFCAGTRRCARGSTYY